MVNILAFNGSPRKNGNSVSLLNGFIAGAEEENSKVQVYNAHELKISPCRGCLKCETRQKCVLQDDDWPRVSETILDAEVIVFAAPIYFHHLPAPLKLIIDRFRSFFRVQVTVDSIVHTPWVQWSKRFVLLLPLGSSSDTDAEPVIRLFEYMTAILGDTNSLDCLVTPRISMNGQIRMPEKRLASLYHRMDLPEELAEQDYIRNQAFLNRARALGRESGGMNRVVDNPRKRYNS